MRIRAAVPNDAATMVRLIRELARYEKAPHQAKATLVQISRAFFSKDAKVFCDIIEAEDGAVAGFAVWFLNFSTWQGVHGMYLEDLFVKPAYRGRGYGKALLKHLARKCVANGYGRLQWWVLDWNRSAIEFYEAMGATAMDGWTVYRVSGEALKRLAGAGVALRRPRRGRSSRVS